MTLAPRLFFGGKFGNGKQAMPWLHLDDYTGAILFLLKNENAHGPYNLISPALTSNEDFMRAIARTLHRPFWLQMPKALLRIPLGEMSVLLAEGRYAQPKRLSELGYQFQYANLDQALQNLLS
jgi:NAD dependent epimerase/dehydratase family enzyme